MDLPSSVLHTSRFIVCFLNHFVLLRVFCFFRDVVFPHLLLFLSEWMEGKQADVSRNCGTSVPKCRGARASSMAHPYTYIQPWDGNGPKSPILVERNNDREIVFDVLFTID
jgi:hypothetical protein